MQIEITATLISKYNNETIKVILYGELELGETKELSLTKAVAFCSLSTNEIINLYHPKKQNINPKFSNFYDTIRNVLNKAYGDFGDILGWESEKDVRLLIKYIASQKEESLKIRFEGGLFWDINPASTPSKIPRHS